MTFNRNDFLLFVAWHSPDEAHASEGGVIENPCAEK
jgi:hypothetical protein